MTRLFNPTRMDSSSSMIEITGTAFKINSSANSDSLARSESEPGQCARISYLGCRIVCPCDPERFGHSDEVRQRPGIHFFHGVATMYFNRDFSNVQLVGDLLVHQAGRDQAHHFALAPRQ